MMSIEAMKQALEALVEVTGWTWTGPMRVMDEVEDAITALRKAIAEAEKQEPVAYMGTDIQGYANKFRLNAFSGSIPLYTTPPAQEFVCSTGLCHYKAQREWVHATQWRGLTDEEIYDYADKFLYQHGSNFGIKSFGKAIEAKLKEKNT